MISVLTMTYQRHHILEEAIQSFLSNNIEDAEMVIINDSPIVQYVFEYPRIRIINLPERFTSIGKKLQWGFTQCKGEFIYRLDDDDLLTPWALNLVREQVKNEGDIFRCKGAYFFQNNTFTDLMDNINNGNCYSKRFIEGIDFPDVSIGEDHIITFKSGGKFFTDQSERFTMIYRWGVQTYHISALGVENANNNEMLLGQINDIVKREEGLIYLNPHFDNDYYGQIPKID